MNKISLKQAIEIVKEYQNWRNSIKVNPDKMHKTTEELTQALDILIENAETIEAIEEEFVR